MGEFLDRQLVAARKDLIANQYTLPLTLANGDTIVISNEIPAGAAAYEFSTYTVLGQAAVILTQATGVPTNVRTTETRLIRVYPIREGFTYTIEEDEVAQELGRNVVSERLQDTYEGINQKLDIVAFVGETNTTLFGLATQPNVTTINFAADGTGSSATWASKTPDQILRDLNLIANTVPTQTSLIKSVDRLILPASQLLYISTRVYSTLTGESILSVFLKNQANLPGGGIKDVMGHPVLENLGAGGVGLIVAYNTTSKFNKLHIPQKGDFRDLPYSLSGTTYTIPCQLKTAGVEVVKPLEIAYANVS